VVVRLYLLANSLPQRPLQGVFAATVHHLLFDLGAIRTPADSKNMGDIQRFNPATGQGRLIGPRHLLAQKHFSLRNQ